MSIERQRSWRPGVQRLWMAVLSLAICGADPTAGLAQTSRADEQAKKQAEKATRVHPYEPSRAERLLKTIETPKSGPYPWFGSIYPGGLLAVGAGYRHRFADTARLDALGGWSPRNYKLLQAALRLPELAQGRLAIESSVSWMDATQVAFYGVGNDSRRESRTTFGYTPTRVGLSGTLDLVRWLAVGGGLDYLAISSGSGRSRPSLEERFGERVSPVVGEDVSFAVGRAFAAVDWRDSPGYSRRGGLYRVEWSTLSDRDEGRFSFRRTEAEAVQLLPILRENFVLAFRGVVTATDVSGEDVVPFYLLPALGGGSSLRGYPSWRFRDRHRLLLSVEYRWMPGELVDMALFVDAGKVAARWSDIDFSDLKTDYGIGIRLHGPSFTALRLDLARSVEGWTLNLAGGAAF